MTSVLLAYDGSRASSEALEVATRLFPGAAATIAYLWTPPFVDSAVRERLAGRAKNLDELIELVTQEGQVEAERTAEEGVMLARAAGWNARAHVRRGYGDEGYLLASIAEDLGPDVAVVGSRGLGGVRAVLGSTSDVLVHVGAVPVLVVPKQMLAEERDAADEGPVVVAYDGSDGARAALAKAVALFSSRRIIVATAGEGDAEPAGSADLAEAGAGAAEVVTLDAGRGGGRRIADALVGCAAEHAAAALVVGSRGRSAVREILLGSVAMGVLHHDQRPVLVVPGTRFG